MPGAGRREARDSASALRSSRRRARRRRRRGCRFRSGRGCRRRPRGSPARVGFGSRSSSALQERIIPEVQKPHWRASAAMKASWSGVSRPSAARPSIVDDGLAGGLVREHQAGADRLAVEKDRAGPAGAPAADDLRAGQPDAVAQGVDERDARLDADPVHRAVDVERRAARRRARSRRSRRRGAVRSDARRDRADDAASHQVPAGETAAWFVAHERLPSGGGHDPPP